MITILKGFSAQKGDLSIVAVSVEGQIRLISRRLFWVKTAGGTPLKRIAALTISSSLLRLSIRANERHILIIGPPDDVHAYALKLVLESEFDSSPIVWDSDVSYFTKHLKRLDIVM
jgi:hypothetical protein